MRKILLFLVSSVVSSTAALNGGGNPYQSGCLRNQKDGNWAKVGNWTKKRVCNSEDPNDAQSKEICIEQTLNYTEVRIYAQNWDSSLYQAWILQILLSELVGVPTSIELGKANVSANFYDPNVDKPKLGAANKVGGFIEARKLIDCNNTKRSSSGDYNAPYKPCQHVMVESWSSGQGESLSIDKLEENDTIVVPRANGMIGEEGWYIPKFTAEKFPSFQNYFGLQSSKENRSKIAETFLTPTTWKDYCDNISNCTNDGTASRPPANETEYGLYFSSGNYHGHFRMAKMNNCTIDPESCTGLLVDYPCGETWSTYSLPQVHHLNIPLTVRTDYTYAEMGQIWRAAAATESHVIMMYWNPEPLFLEFADTNYSFVKVNLPLTTKKCVDNRIDVTDRCARYNCNKNFKKKNPDTLTVSAECETNKESNFAKEVGKADGSCGIGPKILENLISHVLEDQSRSDHASRSPAYDVIQAFQISNSKMNDILINARNENPRKIVCQWVHDNLNETKKLIPTRYPRKVEVQNENFVLLCFAVILSLVTIVGTIIMAYLVYKRRNRKIIRIAQLDFLMLILAGCFLIGVGSLLKALTLTDIGCVFVEWIVILGYVLEMVPLIVKVSALNKLLNAAAKFKKMEMKRSQLFRKVFAIFLLVVIYLVVWTIVDPPHIDKQLSLSDKTSPSEEMGGYFNETIIKQSSYCASKSRVWSILSSIWLLILIFCATVLAYQSRNIRQEFNETKTLTSFIYVNFMFVTFRLLTTVLSGNIEGLRERNLILIRSIIHSVDTLLSLIIYFLPKLLNGNSIVRVMASSLSARSKMKRWSLKSSNLATRGSMEIYARNTIAKTSTTTNQISNSTIPISTNQTSNSTLPTSTNQTSNSSIPWKSKNEALSIDEEDSNFEDTRKDVSTMMLAVLGSIMVPEQEQFKHLLQTATDDERGKNSSEVTEDRKDL